MKQGEIWSVNLDPTEGAEIRKTRPAIIVNDDAVGSYGETRRMEVRPEYNISSEILPRLANESVWIYPNPTVGAFTVRMPESDTYGEIRILDVMGKVVRMNKVDLRFERHDMAGLAHGIYFVEVRGRNGLIQSFRLSYE